MKVNQKILKAINEGIHKGLLSFDDIVFDNSKISQNNIKKSVQEYDPILSNFIDLSLPSGTLWCKWNLGATCKDTPKSWCGDYYMWGSIKPNTNEECCWKNAPFNNGKEEFSKRYFNAAKHAFLNDGTLKPKYDAAYNYTLFGRNHIMKMPTKGQIVELCKLKNEWVRNYNDIEGLNGRIFTGLNGNTLFIPAAGSRWGSIRHGIGDDCYLWSSSLYSDSPDDAFYLYFYSNDISPYRNRHRNNGFVVRGVINKEDIV